MRIQGHEASVGYTVRPHLIKTTAKTTEAKKEKNK
jgi:hypothetical protein